MQLQESRQEVFWRTGVQRQTTLALIGLVLVDQMEPDESAVSPLTAV
jgi:hypothetical protein